MAEMPKTMKAWVVTKNGSPRDALSLKTDWAVPTPPTGADIMVKISYAALNPADGVLMANIPWWLPFRRNAIPGFDFAGEVVRAGPSAPADVQVDTQVCGCLGAAQVGLGKGSLAEYLVGCGGAGGRVRANGCTHDGRGQGAEGRKGPG